MAAPLTASPTASGTAPAPARLRTVLAACLLAWPVLGAAAASDAAGAGAPRVDAPRAHGLIVRLRPSASPDTAAGSPSTALKSALSAQAAAIGSALSPSARPTLDALTTRLAAIGETGRVQPRLRRALAHDSVVVDVAGGLDLDAAQAMAAQLAADPAVLYATPDVPVLPAQTFAAAVDSDAAAMLADAAGAAGNGAADSAAGTGAGSGPAGAADANGSTSDPSSAAAAASVSSRVARGDPLGALQWPLFDPGADAGSAGFAGQWPQAGGAAVTLAIVDTGIRTHVDLGHVGVRGYDFIGADPDGSFDTAGDGDGRDADPTDPGNSCLKAGQTPAPSTWHGTQVSGLIAATVGNALGIAGATAGVDIVSLRAMGHCGGRSSDVIDAIRYAAGLPVAGVPANPTPARVINLSLSTAWTYACDAAMQDAVDAATAAGALVVAAAGNDAGSSGFPDSGGMSAPANCRGVVSVGAHTRSGDRAAYSNFAPTMTLTAPGGGDCASQPAGRCLRDGLVSTSNTGTDAPAQDGYQTLFVGTSAATPLVSAAAAMLWARRPELLPGQVFSALVSGARAWPADAWCAQDAHAGLCGAGMLDVAGALAALQGPLVTVRALPRQVAGGTGLPLAANVASPQYSSAQMRYEWTIGSANTVAPRRLASVVTASGVPQPASLDDTASASPTLTTPAVRAEVPVAVRVTDPAGRSSWATARVSVDNPPRFDAEAPMTVRAGQPLAIRVRAVDPDGDNVRYALVSGPAGLTVDATTGDVAWPDPRPPLAGSTADTLTPASAGAGAQPATQSGAQTVVVAAQDDFGATAEPLRLQLLIDGPAAAAQGAAGTDGATGGGAGGGGGGGGAIEWRSTLLFVGLALVALHRLRPRRGRRSAG